MLKGRNGYRRTGVLRDRLLTRAKACRGGGRGQIKQAVVGERRKERMGEENQPSRFIWPGRVADIPKKTNQPRSKTNLTNRIGTYLF